jgi:hypothetical protein
MRLCCIVRLALATVLLAALLPPAAALGAVPATTDFGAVTAGGVSPIQTVTLANPGPVALTVGRLTVFGTAFQPVTSLATCERVMPAGGHCDLQLRFAPAVAGDYRGRISADGGALLALLTGTAVGAGAPTGGIGTPLAISRPAASTLPTAFAAHVRWHKAQPRHKPKHKRKRGGHRAKRQRHK